MNLGMSFNLNGLVHMLRMRMRGMNQVLDTLKNVQGQAKFENISDFGNQLREQIIVGIRRGNRKSAYHGYPSRHPGALEESVKISYPGRGVVIASVYAPYAEAVEFGRGKVRNKLMVFKGKGGEKVFTYQVASTKPGKRYMQKAANWAARNARKYFEKRMNRVIGSKGKDSGYGVLLSRK